MPKTKKKSATTRAKNLLRRFFNVRKRVPVWKEIQAIRQETGSSDFPSICAIVESNPAFPFPGIGNTFPVDIANVPEQLYRRLRPLDLAKEAAAQVARINHHKVAVSQSLASLANINTLLVSGDLDGAEMAIAAHKSLHGISFIVAKKELLLGVLRHGLSGLQKKYMTLTSGVERTAWALLCRFVYDLVDPTLEQARAGQNWLTTIAPRLDDHAWYARIIEQEILTVGQDSKTLACTLLRYSALSLTDLALLIWRNKEAHVGHLGFSSSANRIAPEILKILDERFTRLRLSIPSCYQLPGKLSADVELYRLSYFFHEIKEIATWRSHLTQLAYSDLPAAFPTTARPRLPIVLDEAIECIVNNPRQAPALILSLSSWETAILDSSEGVTEQSFLAALLVAESLRRINAEKPIDAHGWASLLAKTEDVHSYISSARLTLVAQSSAAAPHPVLKFLLQELIYRKHRTPDNELERRLAFMNIFAGKGKDDITPFLGSLHERDPDTAYILAQTCTRAFLERLYLLMGSLKDVIETRLSICAWLGTIGDESDESLKEERDALTRELANLDARSDLDSTRVHVDEESLREWFGATQTANVSRYIQTVLAEGAPVEYSSLLEFYSSTQDRRSSSEDEDDFSTETQIGSQFLLVPIVSATLEAFSSDRMFGLDAYLSRRIRHGTLSGQIMTPVNRVLGKWTELNELNGIAHNSDPSIEIKHLISEWSKFLNMQLDLIRKEIIQVRTSAHPQGLIRATWKTATNIQHLDAMIARVRQRVFETKGAYDLFPDIYAFCWDCLESDLAQLRLYMARTFLPSAVGKLHELFESLPRDDKNLSLAILIDLNKTIEARILDVCGWFIRPVFRRDKYDLSTLINSNLSIVRELDAKYAFIEKVTMAKEVTLNRGSFDVIGDVLFVLIGNAARHGKLDGTIRISASLLPPNNTVVGIEVISECTSVEAFENAIERIDSAIFVQNEPLLDQAAVEEGFSGLRKLVGLLRRIRSPHVSLRLIENLDDLTINFAVRVPSEISYGRERG